MPTFQYEQVILFGDSITEYSSVEENGLTPLLQKAYIRRLDVVNRGFDGYNTRQALQVLPYIIPSPEQAKLRILTICFGANDATSPQANNDFHIPIDQYKDNLKSILSHPAIAAQKCKVLLITPPPIDEYQHEIKDQIAGQPGLTRFSQSAKDYSEVCVAVGNAMKVPVFDLWTHLMTAAGWRGDVILAGSREAPRNPVLGEYLSDGVHFTSEGYKEFFRGLMSFVSETWPELVPGSVPFVFPTCYELTGDLLE